MTRQILSCHCLWFAFSPLIPLFWPFWRSIGLLAHWWIDVIKTLYGMFREHPFPALCLFEPSKINCFYSSNVENTFTRNLSCGPAAFGRWQCFIYCLLFFCESGTINSLMQFLLVFLWNPVILKKLCDFLISIYSYAMVWNGYWWYTGKTCVL